MVIDPKKELFGFQPAIDIDKITVSSVRDRLEASGRHGFIPAFDSMFPGVVKIYTELTASLDKLAGDVRLVDLPVDDLECVGGKCRLVPRKEAQHDNVQPND